MMQIDLAYSKKRKSLNLRASPLPETLLKSKRAITTLEHTRRKASAEGQILLVYGLINRLKQLA